jgi:hypothetical protein
MKIPIQLIILILLIACQFAYAVWRPQEMLVEIQIVSREELKLLQAENLNFDHLSGNRLKIYVTPAELTKIRSLGYKPEILISNLEEHSHQLLGSTELANYHDYNSTRTLVDSLIAAYPQLIEKHIYGYSLLSRELYAVKISDHVQLDEDEPEISFDGCHHGDEIMSSEVIIVFMRELCTAYGIDPTLTNLVNNTEIWIYPFINPDGRMSMSRYNNAGVDVNRDWGFMWDFEGGSPAPFSQPESQAARDWINENQFVLSQTNHGGDESVSYPWSYRPDQSPDNAPISTLAAGYSSYSGYVPTLAYFQGYSGMYPINGSAKDAYYALMGSVGWTLEVSFDKTPPNTQITQYYNWNRPAMIYLLQQVGKGMKGLVTDASNNEPVAAMAWISNTSNNFWPVYCDPAVGDFHKFLLPGTYNLKVTANGYQAATINNIVVSDTGATRVNVQLQPQTGTFAYRVVVTHIPGNNFSDEGYTPGALGAPDNVRYSLGRSGYIVLDMGEYIFDFPGNDFRIIENDAIAEGYTVRISQNWNGPWTSMGPGSGSQDFDLSGSGLNQFRYLRLEDDGDGLQTAPDAGFDLDAIEGRLIPDSGPFVMASDYMIWDSTSNSNFILEAGETAQIFLTLQNLGVDAAQNVWVRISSGSPYLTVSADSLAVGNILSGQFGSTNSYEISADLLTPSNSNQNIIVQISADGGYHWQHPLPIEVRQGARISSSSQQIGFPDSFIGSTVTLPLVIYNNGLDSLKISQFQILSSQFAVVETGLTLIPGGQQTIHIQFMPDDTLYYSDTLLIQNNDPVNFIYPVYLSGSGVLAPAILVTPDSLAVTMNSNDSTVIPITVQNLGAGELVFTAQIGNYQPGISKLEGSGGNDSFGYIWIDSDEPGGPAYDWIELADGSGTLIPISGLNVVSDPIPLGFTFSFYGENFSNLRICSNGWISFNTFSVSYNNTSLPSNLAPRSMIAPLWDNLNMLNDSKLYYLREDNRFIVQWEKMYTATGFGPYTFQLIIYDNGGIVLQYKNLVNLENAYTVGMQNSDASDGFYIAFNEPYLHDQLAILTTRRSWVSVYPVGGTVAPASQLDLQVTLKTKDFPQGDFWASVEIYSNDPQNQQLVIPIHLTVDSMVTALDLGQAIPTEFRLEQNYPNPFNPTTIISWQSPRLAGQYGNALSGGQTGVLTSAAGQAVGNEVELKIYNLLGQTVRILVREPQEAGYHSVVWDGRDDVGNPVASGIYIYRLTVKSLNGETENFVSTRKMVLMK